MVGYEKSLQAASEFPVSVLSVRLVAELCSAEFRVPPLRPTQRGGFSLPFALVGMVGYEKSLQAASEFPVSALSARLVAELCSAEFRVPPLRPNLTNSNIRNSKRIANGLVRFFLYFSRK